MILAIDIGNTNIAVGGFEGEELRFVAHISTGVERTEDEYAISLLNMLALYGVARESITGGIISSVVPALNAVMRKAVGIVCGREPLVVGPGIKTGLNLHCDNPTSVGSDLICACVAAQNMYGAPCLIADLGTATKIMMVDKRGAFVGVSIMPGVLMGLDALSRGTAQLPQVSLEAPRSVLGKNTVDSMKAGAVYGHAAMIDGVIDRARSEFGEELRVYATGGLASAIAPYCRHSVTLDESMVLKGLNIIYGKNA